jgi:DUF1680 family protein
LGTQNAQGLKQYFFPLASGYWRAYNSADESFWCCTGTGAEEFAKFADTIFFHRGEDVYVNQFIASTLDWKEQGFTIEQVTQFPHEQGTTLKIASTRPVARTIHVRIPNWTMQSAAIEINGQLLDAMADPGAYLAIRRTWQEGDTIKVRFPMELRQEPLAGDDLNAAVLYGPLVLAANLGPGPTDGPARIVHGRGTAPEKLPTPDPTPTVATDTGGKAASWVEVESAANLQFVAAGQQTKYALMPMCEIVDQRYSVYWRTQGGKRLAS